MAAYYKVEVSLNTNSVTVGAPSAQEVLVTLPLVGPAGATGPQGPAGAGAVESVNAQTGVVVLSAADVGAAETLHASQHEIGGSDVLELDSQQVLVDSVFLSTASANLAGIYLRNGSDNSKPLYENAEYRTYFWWDSDLSKWFLANSSDVNLFESSSNTTFPWQATSWSPISPQTGSIDVDQAQLFDVSDQSIGNPSLLRTAKSGNATSTELVLGSDTRLTNSRTPSSTLAHAASHHTGGTDEIAARSIGALAVATRTQVTYSTDLTIAAARHTELIVNNTNASGITLNLPPAADGTLAGDTISIVGGPTLAGPITIVSIGTFFTYTLATITAPGQRFTARAGSSAAQGAWELITVDKHTHVAADITSGTLDNALVNFAAPASIGSTTPNTGAFSTIRVDPKNGDVGSIVVGQTTAGEINQVTIDTAVRLKSSTNSFQGSISATALTADRTYSIPNSSGTIALLETLPAGGPTNLWIPASAWIPRTTGGCGVDSREVGATNRANVDELLFDTGTEEFAQALVVMPSNYNNSTLTARFYWSAASGSGGVAWGLSGRAYGDDDALDQASGTRIAVTDTFITANDVHVTSATGAVTIDGTPAANKAINFQISRVVGDAADTLGVDARLLGVEIIYTAA